MFRRPSSSPDRLAPGRLVPGPLVPGPLVPGRLVPRRSVPGRLVPKRSVPGGLAAALAAAAFAAAGACGGHGAAGGNDAAVNPEAEPEDAVVDAPATLPGPDTTVVAFDKQQLSWLAGDDRRSAEAAVAFPDSGGYASINLRIELGCPDGKCDVYDRTGTLGVVQKGAGPGGADRVVELARFITPFGKGGAWDIDVTDLRALLTGPVTLQAFIGTYAGPGSAYGNGWLLSATFTMTGGVLDPEPFAVLPVWASTDAPYGDPALPLATSVPPRTLTLPEGTRFVAMRTLVTGHGQGNKDNCSEFCMRHHTVSVGASGHSILLWRDDCATTAVPNQAGTWKFSRAGWCPGADVRDWKEDMSADLGADALAGKAPVTVSWTVDDYENTCRPGAAPDGGTCTGCTLGSGCAYNGGAHTTPVWTISALLIAYR